MKGTHLIAHALRVILDYGLEKVKTRFVFSLALY